MRAGKKAEADAVLAQSAAIARPTLRQHPDMAIILEDYSASLKSQGKPQEAEEVRAEVKRARVAASLVTSGRTPF
jgi:hypothetical protein